MQLSHQCSLSGFALQIIALQIIVSVPSTASDDCPCEKGVPKDGFCYRLLKDSSSPTVGQGEPTYKGSWEKSRIKCRGLEFDMPMVKTKPDTERLRGIINTLKPDGMGTWLGLGDVGCTDRWRWIDKTPAKYFSWSLSEPKYKENCVYMSYERGWEEVQCGGQKRETICERPCSGYVKYGDIAMPELPKCPVQEKIKYKLKIHTKKGHTFCYECTKSTMIVRFVDQQGDKTRETIFSGRELEGKKYLKDLDLKDIGLIKSMIIRRNDTKSGYWKFNYFELKIEKYDETYFFESTNGVFSYDTEIPVFNRTGKPRPEPTITTPRATGPKRPSTPRPPIVTNSKAPNTTLAPPKQVDVPKNEKTDDSDLSTVEWIGIAAGIIVALVIIVVIFVLKRKKAPADKSKTGPSAPAPTPTGNKPPAPASTGTAPVLDKADKDLKSERSEKSAKSEKSDDEGSESASESESEAEDD